MSKAQTLASLVSLGNVLEDGTIDAAEIGDLTLPAGGDIVGTTSAQTLTGKTIAYANNTLTGVLPTSAIGVSVQAYDANITTATNTQTLTNKTIDASNNTISNVDLTTSVTGTLSVARGGTGSTTLTANNVLLGNGTAALQKVAPGASGNVLTSNGTTWTSAPAGGGAGAFVAFSSTGGF